MLDGSLLPLTTRSLCKIEQLRPLGEWRTLPRKPWKTLKCRDYALMNALSAWTVALRCPHCGRTGSGTGSRVLPASLASQLQCDLAHANRPSAALGSAHLRSQGACHVRSAPFAPRRKYCATKSGVQIEFWLDRNGAADGACDRRPLEVPGYPIAVSSWAIAIARRARTASARECYK
jgi:hypothetical protein